MPIKPPESYQILDIYLLVAQYPMLASRIRRQMRHELFQRGIITPERFEQEVREKAVLSQQREGLLSSGQKENAAQWNLRFRRVQRTLTDFYFAYNLPEELLHKIIDDLLAERHEGDSPELRLRFNPELAPLEMVLGQCEKYEALPQEQRLKIDHHLQELRVVLLKSLVSDQLAFIHVARNWFTAADFKYVLEHRIGTGKIGGKAAGMLLASKILQNTADAESRHLILPCSYFIGANVFYDFMAVNNMEFIAQKYKSAEQISLEYPDIQKKYATSRFPEEVADQLREILREVGKTPLIVRSSSLLEDNFGTSFAGKYDSFFCPNQGNLKENLRDLIHAIQRIYASVYSPDAMIYRRRMGLLDYDERMAILLQEVQGQRHRQYYFPAMAGVAYSYSPIIWNPLLRREEGFLRLVMGLGTRAVDRVGNDYPRMVNLSHPLLRPELSREKIRYYSQHDVDVLDLEKNEYATVPAKAILGPDFGPIRWIISVDDGETLQTPLISALEIDPDRLVLTFNGLLQRSNFIPMLKKFLSRLSQAYLQPVDVEFTLSIKTAEDGRPEVFFHLLQCRPQSKMTSNGAVSRPIPKDLPEKDRLFICTHMVPEGNVSAVEYVVYVDPDAYHRLDSQQDPVEVARWIGQINKKLDGHPFILIGPGRWGSSDGMLGVPVTYADIFNARLLMEVTSGKGGFSTEPSYGTHFFQDLAESQIFPLAISQDDSGESLNVNFIRQADDQMPVLFPDLKEAACCIKVIHIPSERPGRLLEIGMDGKMAVGYFLAVSNP
jgi:hypothetical protein